MAFGVSKNAMEQKTRPAVSSEDYVAARIAEEQAKASGQTTVQEAVAATPQESTAESPRGLAGVENDISFDVAQRAYYWSSFDPERAGKREIDDYVATMKTATSFYSNL